MSIRFKELAIGEHFRLVGAHPATHPKKKVSERCYVFPRKENVPVTRRGKITGVKYRTYAARAGIGRECYGRGYNPEVIPTGRVSPLKRRKGKSRGPAKLAGYSRRRRPR